MFNYKKNINEPDILNLNFEFYFEALYTLQSLGLLHNNLIETVTMVRISCMYIIGYNNRERFYTSNICSCQ